MVGIRYRAYRVSVDRAVCPEVCDERECLECCPQSVFTTYPKGSRRKRDVKSTWVVHPGFAAVCDGCGVCVSACPRGAISVAKR